MPRGGGGNLGSARGTISIDASQARKAIQETVTDFGRAKAAALDFSRALQTMDRAGAVRAPAGLADMARDADRARQSSAQLERQQLQLVNAQIRASAATKDYGSAIQLSATQLQRATGGSREYFNAIAQQARVQGQAERSAEAQARSLQQIAAAQIRAAAASRNYSQALNLVDRELDQASAGTKRYHDLLAHQARFQQQAERATQGQARASGSLRTSITDLAAGFSVGTLAVDGFYKAMDAVKEGFTLSAQIDANRRSLGTLFGDIERGNEAFQAAIDFGQKYGFTQEEMGASAQQAALLMRDSTVTFEKAYEVTARLAQLNPAEGFQGATVALRELASLDTVSLVERFNISRQAANAMKKEIASGGDVYAVVDKYLGDLGVGVQVLGDRMEGAQGAINRNKLAVENFQLALGKLAQADSVIAVIDGLSEAISTFADNLNVGTVKTTLGAQLLEEATSFEDYAARMGDATTQIIEQSGYGETAFTRWAFGLRELSPALFDAAKAAIDLGAASEDVNDRLQNLTPQLGSVLAFAEQTHPAIDDLDQSMLALALSSDESAATLVSLIGGLMSGEISAEQFRSAIEDMVTAQQNNKRASEEADAATKNQVEGLENLAGAALIGGAALLEYGAKAEEARKKMEELREELGRINEQGTQALGSVLDSQASFLSEIEARRAEHNQRMQELESQLFNGEITQAAYNEQVNAANVAYTAQEQAQAASYARQQAAQMQHLGQMLINYIDNQAQQGVIAQDRAAALIEGVRQEYGVLPSIADLSWGAMTGIIQEAAQNQNLSVDEIRGKLRELMSSTSETRQAMDSLVGKRTVELETKLQSGDITPQEYAELLARVPGEVLTEFLNNSPAAIAAINEVRGVTEGVPDSKTITLQTNAGDMKIEVATFGDALAQLPPESMIWFRTNSGETAQNIQEVDNALVTLPDGRVIQLNVTGNAEADLQATGDAATAVPDFVSIGTGTNADESTGKLQNLGNTATAANGQQVNVPTSTNATDTTGQVDTLIGTVQRGDGLPALTIQTSTNADESTGKIQTLQATVTRGDGLPAGPAGGLHISTSTNAEESTAEIDTLKGAATTVPQPAPITFSTNAPDTQGQVAALAAAVQAMPQPAPTTTNTNAPATQALVAALVGTIAGMPQPAPSTTSTNAPVTQGQIAALVGAILGMPQPRPTTTSTNAPATTGQIFNLIGAINSIPTSKHVVVSATIDPMLVRRSPAPIESMFENVQRLIRTMPRLNLSAEGLEQLNKTLDTTRKIIDVMREAPAAFAAIKGVQRIDGRDLAVLNANILDAVSGTKAQALRFSPETLKQVGLYADEAQKVVDLVAQATTAFNELDTVERIDRAKLAALYANLYDAVLGAAHLATRAIGLDVAASAGIFAESSVSVVDLVAKASTAFTQLDRVPPPDPTRLGYLFATLHTAVLGAGHLALHSIGQDITAESAEFARSSQDVVGLIGDATTAFHDLESVPPPDPVRLGYLFATLHQAVLGAGFLAYRSIGNEIAAESAEFAESSREIVALIADSAQAFANLDAVRPPNPQAIGRLYADLVTAVLGAGHLALRTIGNDIARDAAEFAASSREIVALIGDAADAFADLEAVPPPNPQAIGRLFANLSTAILGVGFLSERSIGPDIAGDAAEFAGYAQEIVALVADGSEAFTQLGRIPAPDPRAYDRLFANITHAVLGVGHLAFHTIGLDIPAQAAEFADHVGRIIAPLSDSVDLFASLGSYERVGSSAMSAFFADQEDAVRRMIAQSGRLKALAGPAAEYGATVGEIVRPLKDAVDLMNNLWAYETPGTDRMQAFIDDTGRLLDLTRPLMAKMRPLEAETEAWKRAMENLAAGWRSATEAIADIRSLPASAGGLPMPSALPPGGSYGAAPGTGGMATERATIQVGPNYVRDDEDIDALAYKVYMYHQQRGWV